MDAASIGTSGQHRVALKVAPFLANIEDVDCMARSYCASRGGVRSWPKSRSQELGKGRWYSTPDDCLDHAII